MRVLNATVTYSKSKLAAILTTVMKRNIYRLSYDQKGFIQCCNISFGAKMPFFFLACQTEPKENSPFFSFF